MKSGSKEKFHLLTSSAALKRREDFQPIKSPFTAEGVTEGQFDWTRELTTAWHYGS